MKIGFFCFCEYCLYHLNSDRFKIYKNLGCKNFVIAVHADKECKMTSTSPTARPEKGRKARDGGVTIVYACM